MAAGSLQDGTYPYGQQAISWHKFEFYVNTCVHWDVLGTLYVQQVTDA